MRIGLKRRGVVGRVVCWRWRTNCCCSISRVLGLGAIMSITSWQHA
jgi:hypothetical protein